ncbi:ATP-dependent DNA ligase LigA [Halovenus rubra]|uniref:DNA ligase n=2 Tax=Halovenus rubra TaxID=869890 RepID=A0ABD5X1S5_9EURY|nr:ATP-dependent DNA ligase LigA [Halovenus rubra]
MEFVVFADHVGTIESIDADIERCERVAELLAEAEDELSVVVRFLLGRVFPAHESTKLDVGPRLCYEALARAAGHNVTASDVEERVASEGDIGQVAESYDLGGQQGLGAFGGGGPETLTVNEVRDSLETLAGATGEGSQETKRDILFDLFNRAEPEEARYLVRLVLSEMRIGVGEGAIRDAIASAFDVPVDAVESALQVSNDYGLVAEVARSDGEDGLGTIQLEIGRPVQAMLAQSGAVTDAVQDWDTVAVERKYDGARVQAHYDGDTVSLYSRNMEDVTNPLPEVVSGIDASLQAPAILDGEVVAIGEDGDPRPFQEVLRRFRRKHDVARARENVEVRFHAFDCFHADGDDLLDEPLVDRHDRLTAVVDPSDHIEVSQLWTTDDPDKIADIEAESLEAGHEGIMLKNPESGYTPGNRGQNWLKRKPDVETIDCVVTGAEWGEGRRANLLGSFELSVRDGDGYATVGKVATGITDEELDSLTERLTEYILTEDGADVDIEPAVVFEVGYEEIQESPTYSAGYALRFPRFLGVREDKSPADADSLERLERLAEA